MDVWQLLNEIYDCDSDELLAQLTCGDSRNSTPEEKQFTLVEPAYLWLVDNYIGQDSLEYEQLCKLMEVYKPSPMGLKYHRFDSTAQDLYHHLNGDRPYEVEITRVVTITATVWGKSADEAEDTAMRFIDLVAEIQCDEEIPFVWNDEEGCGVYVPHLEVEAVDGYEDVKSKDVGRFVEDEPEQFTYEWQGHGLHFYEKAKKRGVYIQGEEGAQLFDTLEEVRFQSQINNMLAEYFADEE